MKRITNRQYDSFAKRIEKNNLKNNGKSLSWVSILNQANQYKVICEIESDRGTIIVKDNWKEILTNIGKIVQ